MKDFRMSHWAAAGLGLLTVTTGFALGCGSDGTTSDLPQDEADRNGGVMRWNADIDHALSPVACT